MSVVGHLIVLTLALSVIVTAVYGFLWRTTGRRYQAYWAMSWAAYSVRLLFELAAVAAPASPVWRIFIDVFAGIQTALALQGVVVLAGHAKLPFHYLMLLPVLAGAWSGLFNVVLRSPQLGSIPVFVVMGVVQMAMGWFFVAWESLSRFGVSRVLGYCTILLGLHRLDYPLVRNVDWMAPYGFIVSAVLTLSTAVLMLMLSLQEVAEERDDSNRKSRVLFEKASDTILVLRPDGEIIDCNEAATGAYGYSPIELRGMNVRDLHTGLDESVVRGLLEQASSATQFETVYRRRDGTSFPADVSANSVAIGDESIIFSIIRDLTKRKELEEKLTYLGMYDPLTRLYNRTCFEHHLSEIEEAGTAPVGLIIANLDGLKLINNTLGYGTGDAFLQATARVLKECAAQSDLVARLGGDEFAVVLQGQSDQDLVGRCHTIREAVAASRHALHPTFQLGVSLGYAFQAGPRVDFKTLLREADAMMCRDKMLHAQSSRSALVQTLQSALRARDIETDEHEARLGALVTKLAEELGLSERSVTLLQLLARFHDIGKVGVPDSILLKPGSLTPDEWREMRKHSEKGYQIALSSPDLHPIAELILRHHEAWNGGGYPLGLQGEEIPLECRILAIADAYDAMTSDRPYRKALSSEAALMELERCTGSQFDPGLVPRFIACMGGLEVPA